jgi:hypothetical protein
MDITLVVAGAFDLDDTCDFTVELAFLFIAGLKTPGRSTALIIRTC